MTRSRGAAVTHVARRRPAPAGLTREQSVTALLAGVDQVVDDGRSGRGDPEVLIFNLLRKGRGSEAEVVEPPGGHDSPPCCPVAARSNAPGGLKGTASTPLAERRGASFWAGRWAFFCASTGRSARRWSSCSTHGNVVGPGNARATVLTRPPRE